METSFTQCALIFDLVSILLYHLSSLKFHESPFEIHVGHNLTSFHLINRSILCNSNVELFVVILSQFALRVYTILCKMFKLKLHPGGRVFKHKLNMIEVACLPRGGKWHSIYSLLTKKLQNRTVKKNGQAPKSFFYIMMNVTIRILVMPWRGRHFYSETKIVY